MPRRPLVERAQYARAQPGKRIELLDRRIGAVREQRAGLPQRAVGVRPVRLAGPEAICEVAIGWGMAELDRGCDAEPSEALDIVRRQALGVLDPVAQAPRAPLVGRLLECVEGVAVRAVADRVHRHRPSGPGAA